MATINFGNEIQLKVNADLKKVKVRIVEKNPLFVVLHKENDKFEIDLQSFRLKKERLKELKLLNEFEKLIEENISLNSFKLSSWKSKATLEAQKLRPNKSRLQFYMNALSGYKSNLRYDNLRKDVLIKFKMKLVATIEKQTRKVKTNEKTI